MKLSGRFIVEQQHAVINHLGHEVVGLWLAVERNLHSVGDPQISWRMESSELGWVRSLLQASSRRDVLVVSHSRFREFSVAIFSRAHGRALHVSRTIYARPRFVNDLRRSLRLRSETATRYEIGGELDLHSVMDLRAFTNITRIILNEAIRDLTGQQFEEETFPELPE